MSWAASENSSGILKSRSSECAHSLSWDARLRCAMRRSAWRYPRSIRWVSSRSARSRAFGLSEPLTGDQHSSSEEVRGTLSTSSSASRHIASISEGSVVAVWAGRFGACPRAVPLVVVLASGSEAELQWVSCTGEDCVDPAAPAAGVEGEPCLVVVIRGAVCADPGRENPASEDPA